MLYKFYCYEPDSESKITWPEATHWFILHGKKLNSANRFADYKYDNSNHYRICSHFVIITQIEDK